MKHLAIDSTTKEKDAKLSPSREQQASSSDAVSCISSADTVSIIKESEMNNAQDSSVVNQGMYYYGYYYPGFNGAVGGWDDTSSYYGACNNLGVHPNVVQADGSYLYYVPGYENGYGYSPVTTGAVVGGQFLGQQQLYYSEPVVHSPAIFTSPVAYAPEIVPTSYTWDPSHYYMDGPKYLPNSYDTVASSKSSRNSKPKQEVRGSSSTVVNMPNRSPAGDQPPKPANKSSGAAALTNGYPSTTKPSLLSNKAINLKERNKPLESGGYNSTNEKNSRTNSSKNNADPSEAPSKLKNAAKVSAAEALSKEAYNLPDFCTQYDQALFFVIKSYSEDDIHKSIKYNVWASTPNGNKRLDNAYRVAQAKMAEKGTKCPVLLFFSVNGSGQFCGVAEMAGPVDFSKNMDFWQQDKWNGFFPVKWHIIKDVPNPQLRHIILENNENKPVTNSRDTQEVNFPQGTEVLCLFKKYSSKTSILDDFDFYENRQKAMQDRRSKSFPTTFEHPLSNADKSAEAKNLGEFRTNTPYKVLDNTSEEQPSASTNNDQ